jgi:hypothetical protein
MLAAAPEAAAGEDPCARFADADAYNNCLAGFGPVAAPAKAARGPAEEGASPKALAPKFHSPQAKKPQAPSGPQAKPAGRGRMRMEFMVPSAR